MPRPREPLWRAQPGEARLLGLAFLTGFCGLGSETLYFKLLDYAVGSAPLVVFTVVAAFILGVGLGAWASSRVRRPWLVEAALTAYNLAWLLGFGPLLAVNGVLLARLVPLLGANLACALVGLVYVAPPALLLGVTFPALVERRDSVAVPYLVQAIGAVVGVVAFEALVFPRRGLPGCLALLVGAHLLASLLLFGRTFRFEPRRLARLPGVLVVVGTASGGLQGAWLFLGGLLFEPLYFVAPTVVATALVGVFAGALLWLRLRWDLGRTLLWLLGGIVFSAALAAVWTHVRYERSLVAALTQLPLLVLPVAVPAGALLPAYLRDRPATRSEAGAALLALSLGNACGLLLAASLAQLGPPLLPLFVAGGLLVAVQRYLGRAHRLGLLLLAAVLGLAVTTRDGAFMRRTIRHGWRLRSTELVLRGPGELSGIYRVHPREGEVTPDAPTRRLYQSGHSPLVLGTGVESNIGIVGAAYAPRNGRALVVGGGTGRSAGTVARVFERVDIVDIGATVRALMRALPEENYGVLDRPGVRLLHFDGVIAPYALAPGYDLIINTVDPGYLAKAAKLFTVEAVAGLKRLLAPDGVFVFWADLNFDFEGNQILMNTGRRAFVHQQLVAATAQSRNSLAYYFLVHSDAPLTYRPRRFGLPAAFADLKEAQHLFRSGEPPLIVGARPHPTAAVHTLARPARAVIFGGRNRKFDDLEPGARGPSPLR